MIDSNVVLVAPRTHRPRPPAVPRRPNYALRRLVAVLVVLVVLVAAAAVGVGLLTGFGGEPASASGARSATVRTHLVQPGDTLWEIAVEHHGQVGLVTYLEALIADNGGSTIDVGQSIRLP